MFQNDQRLGLGDVAVTIRSLETNQTVMVRTSGDGIVRVLNLHPGRYTVRAEIEGYRTFESGELVVHAGELVDLEATLVPTGTPSLPKIPSVDSGPAYRTLPLPPPEGAATPAPPGIPPPDKVFTAFPNRWKFDWPEYRRYGPHDELPYTPTRWYNPFDRNKLKGDYPIIGQQTFLSINLTSDTLTDGRMIPLPNGIVTVNPNSSNFFGGFGQFALLQNFGFSFNLFHGDTSFKPVDWQIKITPEVNVNYLAVQEDGVVNANPTDQSHGREHPPRCAPGAAGSVF
jgi:hypothetical protein